MGGYHDKPKALQGATMASGQRLLLTPTVTGQTQFVIAGLTRNLRRILARLRLGGRNDGLQSD